MTVLQSPPHSASKVYDLAERTAKFGEAILSFAQSVPRTIITTPLLSQLVRSGTSIGANYCEADCAESRKDFEHKLGICKKEAKETTHWLRMLKHVHGTLKQPATELSQESHELQLIFITIIRKSRERNKEISND